MVSAEMKENIARLRRAGYGYKTIAARLGLSRDSVRNVCKHLDRDEANGIRTINIGYKTCALCGREIIQSKTGRPKRFCSDSCRMKYWKIHRDELNKSPEALYTCTCMYCGKTFQSYGNPNRKYCCHEHYIRDYFPKNSSESACYCGTPE